MPDIFIMILFLLHLKYLKMSSFQAAIELLMKVIGLKFRLNRITVLHTKVTEQKINRVFQWVSEEEYRLLIDEIHFSKVILSHCFATMMNMVLW